MSTTEKKALISFQADPKLKEEATKVLAEMQLDLATACNLFLKQVVKQDKLPFEITNEPPEQRELKELRASVERGILQARAGEGSEAKDYLAQLKVNIINEDI